MSSLTAIFWAFILSVGSWNMPLKNGTETVFPGENRDWFLEDHSASLFMVSCLSHLKMFVQEQHIWMSCTPRVDFPTWRSGHVLYPVEFNLAATNDTQCSKASLMALFKCKLSFSVEHADVKPHFQPFISFGVIHEQTVCHTFKSFSHTAGEGYASVTVSKCIHYKQS